MASINVIVHSNHVIFDDDGHAMNDGYEYKVKHGPLVDEYLSIGLLVELTDAPAEDTAPAKSTTKSTRAQATDAEPQEN